MSERERLAAVVREAILGDASYAWVRDNDDGRTVAVDGDIDTLAIADAILAAGFGGKL